MKVFYPTTPELHTGAAVVVAPGGGYSVLPSHEGEAIAEWLADHGVRSLCPSVSVSCRCCWSRRLCSPRCPSDTDGQHAAAAAAPTAAADASGGR